MRKEDLIEFANRWGPIARSKRERVVESDLTPTEGLALGDALREHMRVINPNAPGDDYRRADRETHIRLIEALRSVEPRNRS